MTDIEYTPGPLLTAAQTTRTALWNDSADLDELRQSISFGGVGATCNPVIAYTVIRNHMDVWVPRILAIAEAHPTWGESEIGWQAVKDLSVEAAVLLEGIFAEHKGRNGRLSMQTDPRFHRDAKALADQAVEFHGLAENIVVKIPATRVGIARSCCSVTAMHRSSRSWITSPRSVTSVEATSATTPRRSSIERSASVIAGFIIISEFGGTQDPTAQRATVTSSNISTAAFTPGCLSTPRAVCASLITSEA